MKPAVRLGFDPEFRPLSYDDGGVPAGRAIDLVRTAGERAGIALEFVPVGMGAADPVVDFRLSGFACMAVTPKRTDFSFSVPYITTTASLFYLIGWDRRATGSGVTVTTPLSGPLYEPLSEIAAAGRTALRGGSMPVGRVAPGTDYVDCLRRVLRGEVDAAALNSEVGHALAARLSPDTFLELPAPLPKLGLAVALCRGLPETTFMLSRLNPELEYLRPKPVES